MLIAAACTTPHADDLASSTPPAPDELAYSLTLPAALTSPSVARAAARRMLAAHGLQGAADATLQAVGELTACACRFTAAEAVYLSLRYRDGTIRITLHDSHPRHTSRHLAAACDRARGAVLGLLDCVVEECDGDWGFGEAREPGGDGGTRMWAVLPCAGARRYGGERLP
ncbi:ATP-binding protein [Streptomyces sp. NPDC002851]